MPTTAPFAIYYPDETAPVAPLENLFLQQANSVNTQLGILQENLRDETPARVASQSARDARFPSPAQGDRAFRTDLMREEVYYGTYNSGSNPNGATPAGWYPAPGSDLTRTNLRGATDAWPETTAKLGVYGASWPSMPAGRYLFAGTSYVGGPTGAGNYWVRCDNVISPFANGSPLDFIDGQRIQAEYNIVVTHATSGTLSFALDVWNTGVGTKWIYENSYVTVLYLGPPR